MNKAKLPDNPKRHVAPGRVIITPVQVTWPDVSVGGILIPQKTATGMSYTKLDGQGQEVVVNIDTSTIFGLVTGCGVEAERGSYTPFDAEKRDPNYPLPVGTRIKLVKANQWKVSPKEDGYLTEHVLEYALPGEVLDVSKWGIWPE